MPLLAADLAGDSDGSRAWIAQWALAGPGGTRSGTRSGGLADAIASIPRQKKEKIDIFFHDLSFFGHFLLPVLAAAGMQPQVVAPRGRIAMITAQGPEGPIRMLDSLQWLPVPLADTADLLGMPDPGTPGGARGWSSDPGIRGDLDCVRRRAEVTLALMCRISDMSLRGVSLSSAAYGAAVQMGLLRRRDPLPPDLDRILRPAYAGGINYSNPGIYQNCIHIDVSSMYAAVMAAEPLPYGPGVWLPPGQVPEGSLTVGMYRIGPMCLKRDKIPWMRFKAVKDRLLEGMAPGDVVRETSCEHELMLTGIDAALIAEHYDCRIEPAGQLMCWPAETGGLAPYVGLWRGRRDAAAIAGDRLAEKIAKMMLNALSGRLGMLPLDTAWSVDPSGCISAEAAEPVCRGHLPTAAVITAHGRRRLLDAGSRILAAGGTLVHADTDSWIYQGPDPEDLGLETGPGLGRWRVVSRPETVVEGGVKRYAEICQGQISLACSGVPQPRIRGVPAGMQVEILDDPAILLGDASIGRTGYRIRSRWLRDLYIREGMDPDCVDTRRPVARRLPGGAELVPEALDLRACGYRLRVQASKN